MFKYKLFNDCSHCNMAAYCSRKCKKNGMIEHKKVCLANFAQSDSESELNLRLKVIRTLEQ